MSFWVRLDALEAHDRLTNGTKRNSAAPADHEKYQNICERYDPAYLVRPANNGET